MALKAGRVGVAPSEVDPYGRIIGGSGGGSGGGLKLYYKDFTGYTSSSSTSHGYYTIEDYVDVEGYTPLYATTLTNSTSIMDHDVTFAFATCIREGSSYKGKTRLLAFRSRGSTDSYGTLGSVNGVSDTIRVFYVKNENLEVLE